MAPSIPLYVAGLIVLLSGLAAVAYQLAEPVFAYFTMSLTVGGMISSYFLRRLDVPPRWIKIGALLLCVVFLSALRGSGPLGEIVPFEAHASQELLLVSALAFTATFCSFLLIVDDAVVFTCVFTIAIIGLTGTVNINRELIFCFVVFLLAAAFLLVHQNYLHSVTGGRNARLSWPLLRTQLIMAGACWASTILLGFLVAIPIQMIGRQMSLGSIIRRLNVPSAATERPSGINTLDFDARGQFNVGLGPVGDDPNEVMRVTGRRPRYWRGRTFATYNGRGWERAGFERVEVLPLPGDGDGFSVFPIDPATMPQQQRRLGAGKRFTYQYRIKRDGGPLYCAADPREVRARAQSLGVRPDGTMGTMLFSGGVYEVVSEIYDPKTSDLKTAGTDYPAAITSLYTNIGRPNPALRALSVEAVEGATNPYEKANNIRRFVARRCTYNMEARAVPPGRDAAEFFLNESLEGYCDLYATATTILCRYAGLPARVVTGFAPGAPAEGGDANTFILTGNDRHAWTEVYFQGHGWRPFDATQDTGGQIPASQVTQAEEERTLWERLPEFGPGPIALGSLGVLALLYVLVSEVVGRLRRAGRLGGGHDPGGYAADLTRVYQRAAQRVARRLGIERGLMTTPSEFAAAAADPAIAPLLLAAPLSVLTRLAERAFYGPTTVTRDDLRQAHAAAKAVQAGLRAAPRRPKERRHATTTEQQETAGLAAR